MNKFIIYGEPKGKGRPRFTRAGTAYTPTQTRDYEKLVQQSFRIANRGMQPYSKDIALSVSIEAYFGTPKSASRIKRSQMLSHSIRPLKKPDTDNIAKIVLDALNGLAYYDDAQVVELILTKQYGEVPCVIVDISKKE